MSAHATHPDRLTRMIHSRRPFPTVQAGTFRTPRLPEIVDADGGNASAAVNVPGVWGPQVETTVDELLNGRYVLSLVGFVFPIVLIIDGARVLVPADRMTLFFAELDMTILTGMG